MSTIQNLKNFIRHGKQARDQNPKSPPDQPAVSNVHAQRHHNTNHNASPRQNEQRHHDQYAMSDPNVYAHQPLQANAAQGDFSAAVIDNRNVAAKAGAAAGAAVDKQQKKEQQRKDVDPEVLERIVAEEREAKGKLPRYPGLERWNLVEKMGDGAFSNVYRARDTQGVYNEVAIKVVRKFEMNSTQVRVCDPSLLYLPCFIILLLFNLLYMQPPTVLCGIGRQGSSSGFQEDAQGSGGAPIPFLYTFRISLRPQTRRYLSDRH
jgi:hypothetical protein